MIPAGSRSSRTDSLEGRPVPTGRPSRLWWLAIGLVAGCALFQPPLSPDVTQPDAALMEDARARLADARTVPARRLALVDLLASIGMTPFAGGAAPNDVRRYAMGAPDSLVGGFIPGRHPIARGELVTVRAEIRDASALDLLEASRILVERSKVENLPSRSLLVAFHATNASDPRQLAQGIEAALWASSKVHARVRLEPGRLRVTYPASDTLRADSTIALGLDQTQPAERVNELVAHLLRLTTPTDTLSRTAVPGHDMTPSSPARPDRR